MNLSGVRVTASIRVIDDKTGLPLEGIPVILGGKKELTDERGDAAFGGLKQGGTRLVIEKRGYTKVDRALTLGWGTNPLSQISLNSTGSRIVFSVKNWLSKLPIEGAKATFEDIKSQSDEKGILEIALPTDVKFPLKVKIESPGYTSQELEVKVEDQKLEANLVNSGKHSFVSNRLGYDSVYVVSYDGKNEELAFEGKAGGGPVTFATVSPESDFLIVSTKVDNVKNKDGYVLSRLYKVNLSSKEKTQLDEAEEFGNIGWSGSKFVYSKTISGPSAGYPERNQLIYYDVVQESSKRIASNNSITEAFIYRKSVVFASNNYYVSANRKNLVQRSTLDGAVPAKFIDLDVTQLKRLSYDNWLVATYKNQNYEIEHKEVSANQTPAGLTSTSRTMTTSGQFNNFVDSSDGLVSAWLENVDGKINLKLLNIDNSKTESLGEIKRGSSLKTVSSSVITYYTKSQQESADYVVVVGSDGKAYSQKISDVKEEIYYGYGF